MTGWVNNNCFCGNKKLISYRYLNYYYIMMICRILCSIDQILREKSKISTFDFHIFIFAKNGIHKILLKKH